MGIGQWRAERLLHRAASRSGSLHLERLARRASSPGPELTLVVAVATRDEHTGHPLREWARHLVAHVWARGRHPALRAIVRRHRLLAEAGPERWTTAALHDRLLDHWDRGTAHAVPALLTDTDEDVRAGARRACGHADTAVLAALWEVLDGTAGQERRALLEALTANPRPLDEDSLAVAWRAWIREPAPRLWALLRDGGREAPVSAGRDVSRLSRLALGTAPPGELCRAVLADGVPEHVRRLVATTCAERGLVPEDPVDRAACLLATGRYEQYRATDPDGALLSAAYTGGSAGTRARLRSAVAAAGELDLVRVLAATAPPRAMSVRERGFLAGRLAAEQAWPELWRLARDLPLAEALAALWPVTGWCPPGLSREAFGRLLSMPPERVAAALSSFDVRGPLRVGAEFAVVEACAPSPDGRRAAVVGRPDPAGPAVLTEYALPDGRVIASYTSEGRTEQWRELLHTGDAVIATMHHPDGRLLRYAGGERICLIDPPKLPGHVADDICAAALAPDGSVVATSLRHLHVFPPPHDGTRRTVAFDDLGLTDVGGHALAVDPATGLIAVGGWYPAVLDARAATVVARAQTGRGRAERAAFAAPSSPVTQDLSGGLTRWRIDDGTLLPMAAGAAGDGGPGLVALPAHRRIWSRWGGYVDAETLREAAPPSTSPSRPGRVWSTPSGTYFATAEQERLHVHGAFRDETGRLLDRPLADTLPKDLDRAEELLTSGRHDGDAAELLALLCVLLDERHGAAVTLGPPATPISDTDIALSPGT